MFDYFSFLSLIFTTIFVKKTTGSLHDFKLIDPEKFSKNTTSRITIWTKYLHRSLFDVLLCILLINKGNRIKLIMIKTSSTFFQLYLIMENSVVIMMALFFSFLEFAPSLITQYSGNMWCYQDDLI